jgi:hypothetical protein
VQLETNIADWARYIRAEIWEKRYDIRFLAIRPVTTYF